MVGVVTKPVNPDDLYAALLPWLVPQGVRAIAVSPPV